jgi:hypothetical protein
MAQAFEKLLREVDTVYHFNGQQTVAINGNISKGEIFYLFIH